ncbi:MAG TPA: helix-turn-helix domain-containing protein [Terriglobales bacterium]|nr:helix-turn-helix domain-containing protein [Terriglobales bacterium]
MTTLDLNPEPAGRRERRRTEVHARIFEAAMRLFAKHGFFNTTVEQITEQADVAKGTFFNYFPGKESILLAMAERQRAIVTSVTAKAADAPAVEPILRELGHRIAAMPAQSQIMLRSLLGVLFSYAELTVRMSELLQSGQELIGQVMKRGQDLGEIRADMAPRELARLFQQTIFGNNALWGILPPADVHEWMDRAIDVFWRGIATHPAPVRSQLSDSSGANEERET